MARKLDPAIGDVLKTFGFKQDACWDCHGTWVVYHKVLEQIAAKAGIKYDPPQVLVAERDAAVIMVVGKYGEKSEWSIGEAVINVNYKVSGKQAAYPYAMAEKRAKDRVILKLIGLHGFVYSEEEADDFKSQGQAPQPDEENPFTEEQTFAEFLAGRPETFKGAKSLSDFIVTAINKATCSEQVEEVQNTLKAKLDALKDVNADAHANIMRHATAKAQSFNSELEAA